MAPSALVPRTPRLCTVPPPTGPPRALPDRDALGAGLLVSLAGCGFGGAPCVGLKIREDNRDVRVRRARAGLGAEGPEAVARPGGAPGVVTGEGRGAGGRRGLIGVEGDAMIDGRSRMLLFGAAAGLCGVVTALGGASKVR